jgi:ABC-2 type transport system permease protein
VTFLYSLRLGRWGVAGFGALAFLLTVLQTAGFYAVAGRTPAERAAFARSMTEIAGQFTVLIPAPIRPDTVGGYVEWRAYGTLAIIVAIWALASATGAARGDEEKGLVEAVLSAGVPRADVVASRFLAFAANAVVLAAAAAMGYAVGLDRTRDSIDVGALAGASIVVVALALSCYSLTLLVSQLAAARIATAAAGGLLLVLFLLNSLGRTLDALRPWRWLSPFHYYDASQPLAPGGAVDFRAIEILLVIALASAVLAALAFAYRDLGSPLWRPPALPAGARRAGPAAAAWMVPVVRGLYERRLGIAVWVAGFVALAAIFVPLTKQMIKPLLSLQGLGAYFSGIIQGDIYPSFIGFVWFGFAQLLVAGYAITQVARWSAEDVDGRLEMTLANPISRRAVVAERAIVLVLATLLIVGAGGFAVALESHREAIDLSAGRVAAASLLLVPFATFFGAIGAVLAARIPRATVGLLGGVAIASYFFTQLGPLFKWPAWTQDISPFHLYGQPLAGDVDGSGLAIMVVVTLVGFGVSAFLMQRRDVGA